MIDAWRKCPADEFIPLMKHMFEYSLRAVLLTLYGLSPDDEQLIRTVHASYDVVSFICEVIVKLQRYDSFLQYRKQTALDRGQTDRH